jgi:Domain of unknown function (DUF3883)
VTDVIHGTDWSEKEVSICVEAYFEHLALELKGQSFVKAQLYRLLAEQTGRTPSSIEFKFQNISAILDAIGREWMKGLAPMANYQELLAEKVAGHIAAIDSIPIIPLHQQAPEGFHDFASFYLEPPPELTKSTRKPPDFIERLANKFDPVARDAQNRALGEAGEKFVLNHEKRFLDHIGRADLAKNVRWIAKEDGDGAGYDILSFTDRGDKRFLEVKTTVGTSRTPFFVSRNEYAFCSTNADNFSLFRLYDFRKGIRGFELPGALEKHVRLSTETFRANFSE